MPRIAVIAGDGIGPEVVGEAVRVLNRASRRHGLDLVLDPWDVGAERYLRDGVALSDEEFGLLEEEYDAILLGALGDPRVPDHAHVRDVLLGLRFGLDLYVNYRPCPLLAPGLSPLKDLPRHGVDVEIFRENTEGPYLNIGGSFREGTPDEVAIQEDVNTWKGVERIVRAAFDHANRRGRKRVTLVDKANALPRAGALWRRAFREVGGGFPEIEGEQLYVDVAAMDLVRRPGELEVVVTSNLFGDILSDLAAQVTGGLGLAASANLHPGRHALFEPVHGSAPDIAGTGRANPLAAIRCAALLLDFLGFDEAAGEVDAAVVASLEAGVTTPDLGGEATTRGVGRWIGERLEGGVE